MLALEVLPDEMETPEASLLLRAGSAGFPRLRAAEVLGRLSGADQEVVS